MDESQVNFDDSDKDDKHQTPPKPKLAIEPDPATPVKELLSSHTMRSKEKSLQLKMKQDKTPEKSAECEQRADLVDNDDGMLSTVEQARLLIAASKTPSKTLNITPVKQNNLSAKRSIESSPITPGKQRRVELITLSSPKMKRVRQE